MAGSPTERSLKLLRRHGWTAQVVENFLKFPGCKGPGIRRDLFGCIDILAVRRGRTLGVQATSGNNHSSRVTKTCQEPRMRAWLEAGNAMQVWSWRKGGKRGAVKKWQLRITEIKPAMLAEPVFELEAG